ncbi:MAG TPA: ABC transporter substrate-binding protein [Candidatus Limnocylindrales bacterium]|nr:ABC transporter substrate-binding protein [Candidatus Limnocylindrales bacterium]
MFIDRYNRPRSSPTPRLRRALPGLAVAVAMLASACGSSASPSVNPSGEPSTSAAATSAGTSASSSSAASPQAGGSVIVDYVGDPGTLNPTKDGGLSDNIITLQIRDRLVCPGQDGGITPCLATSWDTPDPTTYIFHLRQGVTFSNGAPFTAADAKYTVDTLTLSKDSDFYQAEGPIEGTKIIDDHTFEIDLSSPDPYFLEYMSLDSDLGIMPNGWMDQCGTTCDTTTVGTGPFMLKDWVKGDHITLVRNPHYWDQPRPYLDTLTFKVTPDPEAQVLQLKSGAADILYAVPFKDLADLSKTPGITVDKHGSGSLTEVVLNNRVAPFNNLQVREAMQYAINRQQIGEVAMYGYFDPVTDLLPPWHWGHDADFPAPAYDPQKATQLLAQAGYDSGHPLSFELRIINNQDFIDQATLIQQQLAQIGVQVKVTPLDKATFLAPMFYTPGAKNLSWQAGLERFTFGAITPSLAYQTYDTGSYINFCGVNLPGGLQDPTLQSLIDQAKVEGDQTKAKALFQQISQQFYKDALTVYLPWQDNVMATRDRVQDFHVLAGPVYPLQYVWVNDGK